MKRLLVALIVVLALAPGAGARPDVSKLLLGITGDPARFQSQTGQQSAIKHVFLGWQQGMTWGTRLPVFLPQLTPIPMIHLGTGGPGAGLQGKVTRQQIANGQGDAYLLYMNKAISDFGSLVYVRPIAEMNSYKALSIRGAGFSPQAYRLAFARIYLILHGGPRAAINASLRRA